MIFSFRGKGRRICEAPLGFELVLHILNHGQLLVIFFSFFIFHL